MKLSLSSPYTEVPYNYRGDLMQVSLNLPYNTIGEGGGGDLIVGVIKSPLCIGRI